MRALIVEDDVMVAKIFGMVIQSFFSSIDYAVNGEEGFNEYKHAIECSDPYDIIFLDMMMPRVTGLDMLVMVRDYECKQAEPTRSHVFIVMVTAIEDDEVRNKAFSLGCDDFLMKSMSKPVVRQTLNKLGLLSDEA